MPATRNTEKEENTKVPDVEPSEEDDAEHSLLVSSVRSLQTKDQCPNPSVMNSPKGGNDVSSSSHTLGSSDPLSIQWPRSKTGEYVSPEGITYLLWGKSPSEQGLKLYSSDGFLYSLDKKSVQEDSRLWRCPMRKFFCQAVVKELRNEGLIFKEQEHTHPSNQESFKTIQILKSVKGKLKKNPALDIPEVLKKLVAKYSPEDVDSKKFLNKLSANVAKMQGKSLKRKKHEKDLASGEDAKRPKHVKKKSAKKSKKKKKEKNEQSSSKIVTSSPGDADENSSEPQEVSVDANENLPESQAVSFYAEKSLSDVQEAADPEEFVLVYLPKRCLEKICSEGIFLPKRASKSMDYSLLPTSRKQQGSSVKLVGRFLPGISTLHRFAKKRGSSHQGNYLCGLKML